jgi:hypothetical protein
VGLVFGGDDALKQLGAGDGEMGLGVEEAGGALVEVEEVGGAIPGPGAELGRVEGLVEAVGGLALEDAGGVDVGDLLGEVGGEANVVDGDGGLGGDGADEIFAGVGENVDVGMTVEQAADDVASATADGDGEIAAHWRVAGRHAGEGRVVAVAGIEGDVGGAEDFVAEEADVEDAGGTRHGKSREDADTGTGDFVEAVGLSFVAEVVVEEGTEVCSGEVQTGVEGCLDDDVEGSLGGEKDAGLDQETELAFGL